MNTEYSTQRILGPVDSTEYSNGVGTPFIANHPYTDRNYFVFTGWTAYDGAQRQVFVAEISEDFTLSNIRLILPWNEPGDLTTGGQGMVCTRDSGEIEIHLHVSVVDDKRLYGGDLVKGSAIVTTTADAIICRIEGAKFLRKFDPTANADVFHPMTAEDG